MKWSEENEKLLFVYDFLVSLHVWLFKQFCLKPMTLYKWQSATRHARPAKEAMRPNARPVDPDIGKSTIQVTMRR